MNSAAAAATPGAGAKPGATVATQRTMTTVIDAIDPKVPSISFKGPRDGSTAGGCSTRTCSQVKVGDRVDFTWTDAMIVEVSTPKK